MRALANLIDWKDTTTRVVQDLPPLTTDRLGDLTDAVAVAGDPIAGLGLLAEGVNAKSV